MSLLATFDIAASGLSVERKRMDVSAENLANISSTRTPEGGPYRKKNVVVSSAPVSFENSLNSAMGAGQAAQGAKVVDVVASNEPPKIVYDPSHPDADEFGNVAMPNVSSMEEMIDMMTASKAYEANVTTFNTAKSMMLRALDIGGN